MGFANLTRSAVYLCIFLSSPFVVSLSSKVICVLDLAAFLNNCDAAFLAAAFGVLEVYLPPDFCILDDSTVNVLFMSQNNCSVLFYYISPDAWCERS